MHEDRPWLEVRFNTWSKQGLKQPLGAPGKKPAAEFPTGQCMPSESCKHIFGRKPLRVSECCTPPMQPEDRVASSLAKWARPMFWAQCIAVLGIHHEGGQKRDLPSSADLQAGIGTEVDSTSPMPMRCRLRDFKHARRVPADLRPRDRCCILKLDKPRIATPPTCANG